MESAGGEFYRHAERDIRRKLRVRGWDPDVMTERFKVDRFDEMIVDVQDRGSVDAVIPLAGHAPGLFLTPDGRRVLVPRAPRLIQPKAGDCGVWERFLEELLGEQAPFVLNWIQCALADLYGRDPARWRHNQLLALCGPPGCGKSFFQKLVTLLFGGRVADPYNWMVGDSVFNGELAEAEHLAMEDKSTNRDSGSRQRFGAKVKELAVSTTLNIHAKGKSAILLPVFRRSTITLNDDSDYMTALPPPEESILDKLLLVRCRKAEMVSDWAENWKRFTREAPAFIHFAMRQWVNTSPNERFGCGSFHNSELLDMLRDFEPHLRLVDMIDETLWKGDVAKAPIRIKSTDLQARLVSDGTWGHLARQVMPYSTACGVLLSRLERAYPDRFKSTRSQGQTTWLICAPSASEDEQRTRPRFD